MSICYFIFTFFFLFMCFHCRAFLSGSTRSRSTSTITVLQFCSYPFFFLFAGKFCSYLTKELKLSERSGMQEQILPVHCTTVHSTVTQPVTCPAAASTTRGLGGRISAYGEVG